MSKSFVFSLVFTPVYSNTLHLYITTSHLGLLAMNMHSLWFPALWWYNNSFTFISVLFYVALTLRHPVAQHNNIVNLNPFQTDMQLSNSLNNKAFAQTKLDIIWSD